MKLKNKTILLTLIGSALAAGAALLLAASAFRNIDLTPEQARWLKAHDGIIRIAPLPDSPPIDFVDENGFNRGLTSDYIHLIEQQLDIRFEVVHCGSWEEIIEKLKAHEVDVVGSIQNTVDRREFLDFTEPYLSIPNIVLTRKSLSGRFSAQTLQGQRIAIVNRSATHDHLAKLYPEYAIIPVKDAQNGFQMVSFGEVDMMIADLGVASYYIEKLGITNLRVAGNIHYPWKMCFASRKDWPMLNPILNKALANISWTQRRHIQQKWIPLSDTSIIPRDSYLQVIGSVLLLTLLAIGSVVFWNRLLRRQVSHRTLELGLVQKSHDQTANALVESEARFRAMVESSSDMIWELDRAGNFTYASPRAFDILGHEPDQLIGQSILSFLIPTDAATNLEKLRGADETTVIDNEVNTHIHRNGSKVILESSGRAFTNREGNFAGIRGVSHNITARVEANTALKASEERFRNLVETTSDWIWEVDGDGRFIYASPQAADVLGFAPAELLGRRFMDLMIPDDAEMATALFHQTVNSGESIDALVSTNLHKSNRMVVLETSAVPFYDDAGAIQGYRGISRDITDRMAAEQKLEFERGLFRSLMEHAPHLTCFKDADGRFIEVNRAKADEVRLEPEELIGKTDFDFISVEEAYATQQDEQEVMRSREPMQKEEQISTPAGMRWYLTTKVPRHDEHGNVVGTFATSWNITHRKQAEEDLRQLRALLSNVIDSMPSILVGVDLDGNVTQWNREAERVTDVSKREALGTPLEAAFPQLAPQMIHVEQAIRQRQTYIEERIPVKQDKRIRYHNITVYPLLDDDAAGAVIRVDDVTGRVQTEDSIRNIVEGVSAVGHQFFSSMVTQLAKVLNADFAYISEYTAEPAEVMRTISVSDPHKVQNNFMYPLEGTPGEQVLQENSCIFVSDARKRFPESRMLEATGTDHYIGIPLVGSKQRPLGVMVALYREPVEEQELATSIMQVFAGRTAAELERLQANKELLSLQNLLGSIINSMPSILIGVDAGGKVMQWNDEAESATGIDAARAHGLPLEQAFPYLQEEIPRIQLAIQNRELFSHQRMPGFINEKSLVMDITVYPITTDAAEGAVIRVDDVTDRVRLEEMMIQSEKMLSVGGLAAGMAHEINNPLAGILQNMQVMRNRTTQASRQNEAAASAVGITFDSIQTYMQDRGLIAMMESVTDAGQRAAKIVDNMLSFSRKDRAQYDPNDLIQILEQSIELASNDYNLTKRFDFRHIRIEREYDEAVGPVPCEKNQLQQVVLNLLTNSAQAMMEQQPPDREPTITIRLIREEKMARIEIKDNGPGMDEETRKRVFEPFFTTKDVGSGTGLGLSVSYFIITENHGGSMQVDSVLNRGTSFSIRIPLIRT